MPRARRTSASITLADVLSVLSTPARSAASPRESSSLKVGGTMTTAL
jgi:hypothetical protein